MLIGLAACVSTPPVPEATPRPIDTLAPPTTATLTPLPTATSTPLPTATPTPTAQPLYLFDGLRTQRATTPSPQRGAPCGTVDFFDFPLAAPDGNDARAPWTVGIHIRGYSGLHAGEDWIYNGGSLGKPVYSIGHGTVLYAQSYGWGGDLGTIIVRHIFPDGKWILSFYGHLEPDSVVLNAGDCVTRGEPIGRVGNPRGRPHLHFEIRSIFPDRPGPGYWPSDPTLAGWKIPTEYIWDDRVGTSPGVQWTRSFTPSNSILAGLLISNTVAAIDDDQLLALDADTGKVRWTRTLSSSVRAAVIDTTHTTIYLTTISDTLQAIDAAGRSRWQIPVTSTARSVLLPSPDGGVIVHAGRSLNGYAADGQHLWQIENIATPIDWLNHDGQLLFTVGGDQPALYRLDPSGVITSVAALGGQLAASSGHLFVYAPTALYQLSETPMLLKQFDRMLYNDGSLIATSAGGLILSHHSLQDIRLIALRADGSQRWERSIQQLTRGAPQLVAVRDEVYAVTVEGDVWWIDQRSGEAQRVLDGTRLDNLPGPVRAYATARGNLIIDFRGGRIVAFDPRTAVMADEADDRP